MQIMLLLLIYSFNKYLLSTVCQHCSRSQRYNSNKSNVPALLELIFEAKGVEKTKINKYIRWC